MATYTVNSVAAALRAVGLRKGDCVFSHSNMGFFGLPEGPKTADNAFTTLINAIFEVIGSEGTWIVPTFTYSFPQQQVYDPLQSPSDCGLFAERFRQLPEAYRSHDPCVSVAAVGAQAKALTHHVPENTYGPDSFFDRFYRAGGKVCNFNMDAASTFVHYVERCLQVPYRFDKTFYGQIQLDGALHERKSIIYVRHLAGGTVPKFEPFDELACAEGLVQKAAVGRGFVKAISAEATYKLIEDTLPSRPWLLTEADAWPAEKQPLPDSFACLL